MAEPVVIDYETFCKIHDCHDRQRLTIVQTARALGLDPRTVAAWAARSRFEPRRSRPRGNEKGRVESGVGYVKKNFLHGLELTDFSNHDEERKPATGIADRD